MSTPATRIYLASASPRRHDLLNQIGVQHDVLDVPAPPGEDEPQHADEDAASYVLRTAREKAQRAVLWIADQKLAVQPVLSADTTVVLDGEILGKPADTDDAATMLARLSGRIHLVRTAVVLAHATADTHHLVCETLVTFRPLSSDDIARYVTTGEPFGKAGAYGIQGVAGAFVQTIHGSYTGVMGLPIYETAALLSKLGIHVP